MVVARPKQGGMCCLRVDRSFLCICDDEADVQSGMYFASKSDEGSRITVGQKEGRRKQTGRMSWGGRGGEWW